ncbi:PAS domain S-box protein [Desulfosediminicola flagellatus]|uniref:PAS domain S-box protein n=1 Tax=Desulfosediminicola flagellatus TaxID=2569541 RepID=UPI0010AB614E|nr:PAS domain S-box protein [Desulfosediminicola flagellatus]
MPENRYDNRVERFHSLSAENQPNGITFELLQPMLMLSPLGYVITAMNGKDTRIVFVNRSFEEITGYETNEVIGHNWQFLFRDDHHQAPLRRFLEAVEQKRQYTEVVHNCRKDGSLSYTELTVYPILDSYGENIYFIWILRDVTFSIEAEKKLTRKLAEKDKRFSAYMKHSNEALWCLAFDPPIPQDDPQADQLRAVFDRGVFTEANDAAARAYGLEKGIDLQGRPLKYHMDISASDNLKVISSLVHNRFLMENVMTHEKEVDGSDVIAMNNITPGITNGAVTHVWGASLVITELSIAQKDLQQSKNELAAKSKALEEKNIALKELVAHIGLEQKDFKDRLMTNIKEIALPSLERIKLNKGEEAYIDLHRRDLENLASSFGLKVNDIRIKLTPREMEVCNLVRNGLANKEIAEILKIAVHTVEKHRRMARKKLGLNRKNVNLHSYLNSL